jgi:hypothetical protein
MRDPRYDTIQGLLKEDEIKKFTDIFTWIPFSVVAADLGTSNQRMKKMISDPSLWTLEEIYQLADLIGYNRKKLGEMAVDEVKEIKSKK